MPMHMRATPTPHPARSVMRRLATLLLAASLALMPLVATGCGQKGPQRFTSEWTGSFDTVIQIIAYADGEAQFRRFETQAKERFQQLHKLYDRYNSYPGVNNIRTINEQAGQAPVMVAQEIIDLLTIFREHALANGRVVDITLGPVLEIWHDYRDQALADPAKAAVPPLADLQKAAQLRGLEAIEIDAANRTVRLAKPGMSLDVGSVAKGYATELVAQELEKAGLASGAISGGGSNVRLIGKPADPERTSWNIGIRDPDGNSLAPEVSNLLDTAMVNDTSIVTSGDYQRYYIVDGELYHHLIDPATLMPGTHFRAVTIMLKDSGVADFLSSTVFLLPIDQGLAVLRRFPGAEALWVLPDGTVKATEGMRKVLKDGIAQPVA